MKKLYYFGCIKEKGHYLFQDQWNQVYASVAEGQILANKGLLERIDGAYAPYNRAEGQYNEVNIGHIKILAWWDYTVDDRPGSNSNLIGVGYETAEEMIAAAYNLFPSVMNRQKNKPVLAKKHEVK